MPGLFAFWFLYIEQTVQSLSQCKVLEVALFSKKLSSGHVAPKTAVQPIRTKLEDPIGNFLIYSGRMAQANGQQSPVQLRLQALFQYGTGSLCHHMCHSLVGTLLEWSKLHHMDRSYTIVTDGHEVWSCHTISSDTLQLRGPSTAGRKGPLM